MKIKRLNIEVTNSCNLRCPICSDKKKRPISYMSIGMVSKILNAISDLSEIPEIRWFISGEPFLHPYLKDFVVQAMELHNKPKQLIHTNGTLLSEAHSWILDIPNLHTVISCNGGNRAEYIKCHGFDGYRELQYNVQRLLGLDEDRRWHNNKLTVQCCRRGENNDDVLKSLEQDFPGCDIIVRGIHNWDKTDSISGSEKKVYGHPCDFMQNDLVIYADGRVGLCCACLNAETTFGHIKDNFNFNLQSAFQHFFRNDMRERMKNHEHFHPCSHCERYAEYSKENTDESEN